VLSACCAPLDQPFCQNCTKLFIGGRKGTFMELSHCPCLLCVSRGQTQGAALPVPIDGLEDARQEQLALLKSSWLHFFPDSERPQRESKSELRTLAKFVYGLETFAQMLDASKDGPAEHEFDSCSLLVDDLHRLRMPFKPIGKIEETYPRRHYVTELLLDISRREQGRCEGRVIPKSRNEEKEDKETDQRVSKVHYITVQYIIHYKLR
jgi:hypothetical protein